MAKVSGTIAGTSIEGYVRFLRRRAHLCSPGQTIVLNLDPSFPSDVNPSDELVLYENDVLVFTGYVGKATRQKPTFDWIVEGMDTYQRVQATFLDTPMVVGHDPDTEQPIRGYQTQTTDYWIGYILTQCGVSYTIQAGNHTVPQGVQLGLRTAHESLQDIMAYSSQYAYANPSGTIEVKRVSRSATNYTLTEFLRFEYKKDDEWTRNYIKVYGVNSGTGSYQQRTFASAYAGVAGIVPDRIAAIATPMIQTNAEAQRVADYMLSELGDVTWVATGTIVGDPTIQIGKSARMIYDDFDRTDIVTSIESDWDENGYIMQVTIGERCPRISGWAKGPTKAYAGTTEYGVYRSLDNGLTWSAFNSGLPTGSKHVTRLAFNSFEEGMAIVNNRVWYVNDFNSSGSWVEKFPPTLITGGSIPFLVRNVAIDATGSIGAFDLLQTGCVSSGSFTSGSSETDTSDAEFRTWAVAYSSTGSPQWDATLIEDTKIIPPWDNIEGYDIVSNGVPYVIAKSRKTGRGGRSWALFKNDVTRCKDIWEGFGTGWVTYDAGMYGVKDWTLYSVDYNSSTKMLTLTLSLIVYGALPVDNVFMYGKNIEDSLFFGGGVYPSIDQYGTYVWDYQRNAYWVRNIDAATSEWRISTFNVSLANEDMWPTNLFFNFFYSPRRGLAPSSSMTFGDRVIGAWTTLPPGAIAPVLNPLLQVHQTSTSPWGDTYGHQGRGSRYYPYPVTSTLTAGELMYY